MKPQTDHEVERHILGCIVFDNNSMIDIVDQIKVEFFSLETNKTIYQTMLDMIVDKQPIDLITLHEALKGKSIPVEYIGSIADDIITAANIKYYTQILKDLYIKRQILAWSYEASEAIENGEDVINLLGGMVDTAFELSTFKGSNVKHIKNVILSAVKTIEGAHKNKGMSGISSGLTDMDKILCGFKPKYYVLAGRPGTGKTALAMNVAVNSGSKALVFSLEMPEEEVGLRMLSGEAKIDNQQLENGSVKDTDWDKLTMGCGNLSDKDIYIDDSADQTDLDIWTKAKRHKVKHGLDIIIVDYLQLVRSAKKVSSRREELEEISRNFKKISKDLQVPIIALAQLSRACEQEKRKPRLSDLREAGGIEQDADVVMFTHHPHSLDEDEPEGVVEVIFSKHRGGRKGYVELDWRADITRFSDRMKGYSD